MISRSNRPVKPPDAFAMVKGVLAKTNAKRVTRAADIYRNLGATIAIEWPLCRHDLFGSLRKKA
jgi:hypothetical protein